jgi:hypothetical protein
MDPTRTSKGPIMKRCVIALSVLVLLVLIGCGSSTTTPPPGPGTPTDRFPATADILMANFQLAYETMDPAMLGRVTHPQSMIILQQSTRSTFPDVGEILDHTEQTRIIGRMFSGQDVLAPGGIVVPAIQTLQFQTFQRVGSWGMSPPTAAIPNTENALYSVQVLFDRGQNYSTMKVTGNIRFYVAHHDSTVGGQTLQYYQIIGQVDLTDDAPFNGADKPAESSAWGSVHALFR